MKRENNPWSEWVRDRHLPTSTAKLSKVESRVLDNRTWWDVYGQSVQEWFQMALLRCMASAMICFAILLVWAFTPAEHLNCTQTVLRRTPSDLGKLSEGFVLSCENTNTPRIFDR